MDREIIVAGFEMRGRQLLAKQHGWSLEARKAKVMDYSPDPKERNAVLLMPAFSPQRPLPDLSLP